MEAGAGAGKTRMLWSRRLSGWWSIVAPSWLAGGPKSPASRTPTLPSGRSRSELENLQASGCQRSTAFSGTCSPPSRRLSGSCWKTMTWSGEAGRARTVLGSRKITYDDVGRVRVSEPEVSISHDHVISLAVELLKRQKFRRLWRSRFPVLLLDEYQDTSSKLMEAIRDHLLAADSALQIGLCGDHWQMIYDEVCGAVADDRFVLIPKGANFRSCDAVVGVLNRVRPALVQAVSRNLANAGQPTDVVVLHTNSWPEGRGKGHYKNALNDDTQDAAVEQVQKFLRGRGWHLGHGSTSILRLTNKAVARAEGFSDLLAVFEFPDQLLKRQDPIVDMLAGRVEPAADLVAAGRKTVALETVGWPRDRVKKQEDKQRARIWLQQLGQHRGGGTVGDIVEHLRQFDLLTPSAQRALGRARPRRKRKGMTSASFSFVTDGTHSRLCPISRCSGGTPTTAARRCCRPSTV
ncbi:MAG: UvrD-helicase domain-containing protein [Proteobacteria bacterium]|nr:UvrD-helicase domain-containing protein [Pseudomonadota bacterium]